MKKLGYLFPAMLALGLTACGDDVTQAETDVGDDSTSTGDSPTTMTSPTVTTVDPSTSTDPTIDPDTGSDSSSTGEESCSKDDECQVDEDCGNGFNCFNCTCFVDPTNACPAGWGSDGSYAECETGSTDACGASDLDVACDVGPGTPPEYSVCTFRGCSQVCDCPEPPQGFGQQVVCADVFDDPGRTSECVISCDESTACPDDMFCLVDTCYAGEAPPFPFYEDCINDPLPLCETSGLCLSDGVSFGACASLGCGDASDCGEPPATGTAQPVCTDLPDFNNSMCTLGCSDGETCPDGMVCLPYAVGGADTANHCVWPSLGVGFDDCANNPDSICGSAGTCVTDDTGELSYSVCATSECVDPADDCPTIPDGGDSPAICANIDGVDGDECALDCSAKGATCPTGMTCTDAGYCSWEAAGFVLFEDFSDSEFESGWRVIDVDDQTPNKNVDFVTSAWVASTELTAGNPAAISTSWYDPVGTADDWMVSSAVPLSATSVLAWDAFAQDPNFPDGYEVYVVDAADVDLVTFLTTGDPTDLVAAQEPTFAVAAEEATLTNHTLSAAEGEPLEALVGVDVRVLWRNNSSDDFLLVIDNISITQ